MKYAATLCAVVLATFVLGACAFDQGGYDGDDQSDPGSDMGQPDPTNVDPGSPEDPGPVDTCTDDDDDGFFAEPDCGSAVDCHDDEEDAYPGQDEFFEDPISGDDYDYNCDGTDEKELDRKADPARCESGWKKNPPRCGDEKDFITCVDDDDGGGGGPGGGGPGGGDDDCECSESKVVQACR